MEIVASPQPLSHVQAISACKNHQHLKGNVVINETADFEVVDCVCIAPHDKLNRHLFFKLYKEMKDPEMAISFYNDPDYDVVLILRELVSVGDAYYKIVGLREYVETSAAGKIINRQLQ